MYSSSGNCSFTTGKCLLAGLEIATIQLRHLDRQLSALTNSSLEFWSLRVCCSCSWVPSICSVPGVHLLVLTQSSKVNSVWTFKLIRQLLSTLKQVTFNMMSEMDNLTTPMIECNHHCPTNSIQCLVHTWRSSMKVCGKIPSTTIRLRRVILSPIISSSVFLEDIQIWGWIFLQCLWKTWTETFFWKSRIQTPWTLACNKTTVLHDRNQLMLWMLSTWTTDLLNKIIWTIVWLFKN